MSDEALRLLDLMLQAFDPLHPAACHQDCFDVSDGHGYEMQEIAKEKARAFLAQPIPAAREGRLWPEVDWRMRVEDATFVEGRMVTMPCCGFSFGDDYTDGHAEAYTCPLCALADTSPAAAALLAQGETLERIREQAAYGFTGETLANMKDGMSAREMNAWWMERIRALVEGAK